MTWHTNSLSSHPYKYQISALNLIEVRDTFSEKAPSNKTLALIKSMNIDIWIFDTSDQLFIRVS